MIQFGMLAESAPGSLITSSRRRLALSDGAGTAEGGRHHLTVGGRMSVWLFNWSFSRPRIRKPEHLAGAEKISPLALPDRSIRED